MMHASWRRARRRQWRTHACIEHRYQEHVARMERRQRTAQRLGVQLIAWGICPACGCIGAPNHRCAKGAGEGTP